MGEESVGLQGDWSKVVLSDCDSMYVFKGLASLWVMPSKQNKTKRRIRTQPGGAVRTPSLPRDALQDSHDCLRLREDQTLPDSSTP